jgi:hypothetical protein
VPTEHIGVIFVHGIGEQRRFEHLDSQIRPLLDAIRRVVPATDRTVEIVGGAMGTLRAEQDTWASQPVRAIVRHGGNETHLHFHEVWWADVNEPYSFKKEVRFWSWALAVWALPGKPGSKLSGAATLQLPKFPNGGLSDWDIFVARLKLFFASNVFLMGAFSVGAFTYVAKRVFGYSAPPLVREFVNYLSAVRLYNQKSRDGGGFLDAYREPPRVSIRRRMIRTIADVALAPYARWYIFAHSLGSVVAHNGLMESAHSMPNYLDETRWEALLKAHLGGTAGPDDKIGPINDMVPGRPVWLAQKDVVYRKKLFANFRGLLTYGSPLDKFATIWPARVPINNEPAFHADAEWINVYDPTDPVGASLDAFGDVSRPASNVIRPDNYGYRAHWALLYSHLCYLTVKKNVRGLSDDLVTWLLNGGRFRATANKVATNKYAAPYFQPRSRTEKSRTAWAVTMWVIAYAVLTLVGTFTLPFVLKGLKVVAEKTIVIVAAAYRGVVQMFAAVKGIAS